MHELLNEASGSAQGGELVLISGPSRESNVMLLECLGGLQKTLKGHVTINGVAATADEVLKHAAYVACDDLFYKTLTVMEHLQFQAQLTAGKSSCGSGCGSGATEEMTEYVNMVLEELALNSQRHVLIQNLSKVDSKLLAIATALLDHPSILLVEDPTCGLDFYSSQRVVLTLRQLARGGRTVLVTMAHTSSHLYALFDALYLLTGGAAIYHGKASEAVSYFSALGYQCPRYSCPVDFCIRLVSGGNDEDEMNDYDLTLRLKEVWLTQYVDMCPSDSSDERTMDGEKAAIRRQAGCCSQLSIQFGRQIQSLARYRVVFGWHTFNTIVASVLFGLIFFQLDLENQQDIQNWAGAFLSMVVLQMLVMAYRTFVYLPFEMSIVEREHRQGGYHMVCWYLTKVLAEIPAILVLSTLLFLPAYWLIGIGRGFSLYFYMQIVMWLVSWTSTGIATLLLGLFGRVRVALVVYMILLLLFGAFVGLLIDVDDIPDYLICVQYLSPMTYGFEALMKLFWSRTEVLVCGGSDGSGSATFATVNTFTVSSSGSQKDKDGCTVHSGDQVLSHYSLNTSRTSRTDRIILLELAVLYFFLGYIFLSLRWRRFRSRSHCQTTPRDI
uniref:ABC transporter domain-containing protein n=1 Tax=Hyaloperonospora arabidopsidis (strain Emoy2) TaxID=559515 RepID=M4BS86_HYAAE